MRTQPALRYGMEPVPHPDLTYQPDVVLVGDGRSVRSVTATLPPIAAA